MGVGRARSDITDYDIAWLRFSEFMGAFDRDPWIPPPMFVPGKPIVVSSGKLKGALGEIVRAKGQNRMEVLLTAFGRTKRYELPIAELSAA
jgi:transcription antitermination factor NusG